VEHLESALARFSAFFHCPLFEASCTDRELNAVDSENKKNIHDDGWRLFQLGKGLSSEGHPWRKFGTGSRESLLEYPRKLAQLSVTGAIENLTESETGADGGPPGRVLREKLIEWWQREYSAPRMRLAILSSRMHFSS
jgi:insulysin